MLSLILLFTLSIPSNTDTLFLKNGYVVAGKLQVERTDVIDYYFEKYNKVLEIYKTDIDYIKLSNNTIINYAEPPLFELYDLIWIGIGIFSAIITIIVLSSGL